MGFRAAVLGVSSLGLSSFFFRAEEVAYLRCSFGLSGSSCMV